MCTNVAPAYFTVPCMLSHYLTLTYATPYTHIQDEDYMYELKGVLVHAGIAQGGHYYSFIKERPNDSKSSVSDNNTANASSTDATTANDGSSSTTSAAVAAAATGKWYRFDDEDVTVFDPGNGFVTANCVTFYVHLFTLTLPFFNHGAHIWSILCSVILVLLYMYVCFVHTACWCNRTLCYHS
jgi:Ubiquitin carboxyl-terminal hydrolase